MSFLNFHLHRTQLIATGLAAALTTAGLITAYEAYTKRAKRRRLNDEIYRSIASRDWDDVSKPREQLPGKPPTKDSLANSVSSIGASDAGYDEDLVREQLARNYAFFGDEAMDKVRKGSVVIVGCGGVGSWAAIMLARSGVSKIRLIDFDYVTLSSLNRHATALLADVGTPKVNCVARTVQQVARWVEVDPRIELWRKEDGGALLKGADWVIDAIDNITTKVDLLKYCHDHNIKVFSSMGAGAKTDPTRIQIADISSTVYDPLARSVRRGLRLQDVRSGIPVVYSTEVPGEVALLPLPDEEFRKGAVHELGALDDFRVRILPVLGPLPAIFGLNAAVWVICALAGKPVANPLPVKNRRKIYEKGYRDLLHREEKLTGKIINRLSLDEDDICFILEDLHRGRSILPPHEIPTKLAFVRWDPAKPLSSENCVVMEASDADKHMRECFGIGGDGSKKTPSEAWGTGVDDVVCRRAAEVEKWRDWVY